jgi:tetratricopeptide (TPR) repeat protein
MDYAWLCYTRGDAVRAEQLARDALAIHQKRGAPDIVVSNLHLLQVSLAAQRRYDEAEAIAENALAISQAQSKPLAGEASIRRDLAGVAIVKGDLAKAERLARQALAQHRKRQGEVHLATGAGWETLGNVLYHQKKFDEAQTCYRHASAIFVKTHGYCPVNVLTLWAVILDAKGDQTGLEELRPLADVEDAKSGPYGWQKAASRGSLRAKLGDWQKAQSYLEEAVKLAPDDAAEDCAWADSLLALLCLRADDRPGYRAACAAALDRQEKKSNPAYYFVVWASVIAPDSGIDPARLVDLAQSAVESAPKDPDCLTAYGAALYRAGRWEDAQRTLARAVHAYDAYPGKVRGAVTYAQLFLAMTSNRLSRSEEAQKWMNTAIESIDGPPNASSGDYGGLSWDRRLIARLVRDEAEQLLTTNDVKGSAVN